MRVVHCGDVLPVSESREINPTAEEAVRGVVKVLACTYNCCKEGCRKRLYTKQERFKNGFGLPMKVKRNIGAFVARLKLAAESDWVWGHNLELGTKVKRWVR